MERNELKKHLRNYVDLFNTYEKQGNKRKMREVESYIEFIKKQLAK